MSNAPVLGSGYTMLPIVQAVEGGTWGKFPDGPLATYVAIAAHADRHSGAAYPGHLRISRLAGISKTTVQSSLLWLAQNGWLSVHRRDHHFSYRLRGLEEVFDSKIGVPLRQRVVFSGLWAECPPSAKRLFLVLLARSRPGLPGEFNGVGSNFPASFEEARGEEGARHVPHRLSAPSDLARLSGLPDRTLRHAQGVLRELSLVEVFPDSGEWVLPNTPTMKSDRVLASLQTAMEKDKARAVSRGAKTSAAWRLKHRPGSLPK